MIHLAAEKACYVARSVNKTPTAAVLKEALETVSEIELLLHPGSFTVSLAIFWRVWFLILTTFFYYIISKLPEQLKTYQPLQLKNKWRLWDGLTKVQCWVLKWRIRVQISQFMWWSYEELGTQMRRKLVWILMRMSMNSLTRKQGSQGFPWSNGPIRYS